MFDLALLEKQLCWFHSADYDAFVNFQDPELHTEPTESRHQLIEKLKRDLQTREQVIQKQTEELIELQKQVS